MRFQLAAALAGISIVICTAAAAEKDTAAAANTRKKLVTKVTVDFKDEHLNECLEEIARQLDEASGAKMSFFYDSGVSQNQRLTYSTRKDQSVADVLDGMLKKNSLGYVVFSKEKDRYDGWLKIKQGNERGLSFRRRAKGKARVQGAGENQSYGG